MNKTEMLALSMALEEIEATSPEDERMAHVAASFIRSMAEQEPVAAPVEAGHPILQKLIDSIETVTGVACWDYGAMYEVRDALLAPVPTREPLTDEQIEEVTVNMNRNLTGFRGWSLKEFARHIEAAHGIGASHD